MKKKVNVWMDNVWMARRIVELETEIQQLKTKTNKHQELIRPLVQALGMSPKGLRFHIRREMLELLFNFEDDSKLLEEYKRLKEDGGSEDGGSTRLGITRLQKGGGSSGKAQKLVRSSRRKNQENGPRNY